MGKIIINNLSISVNKKKNRKETKNRPKIEIDEMEPIVVFDRSFVDEYLRSQEQRNKENSDSMKKSLQLIWLTLRMKRTAQ